MTAHDKPAAALECVLRNTPAVRALGAAASAAHGHAASTHADVPPELSAALHEATAVADEARVRAQFACVCVALRQRVDGVWPAAQRARDDARASACRALVPLLEHQNALELAKPALLRLCAAAEPRRDIFLPVLSLADAWASLEGLCRALEHKVLLAGARFAGGPFGNSPSERRAVHELFGQMRPSLRNELLVLAAATREESGLSEAEEQEALMRLREEALDEEEDDEEEDEADFQQRVVQAALGHACGGAPSEMQLAALLAAEMRE